MLTRRQIAFIIYAFFKINDVQGRTTSINELLNIELFNDNLIQFDQAWEETVMAPEQEPEEDLWEGLQHRQLDDSHAKCLCIISIRSRSLKIA